MRGPFVLSTLSVDLVVPLGRTGVLGLSNSREMIERLQRSVLSLRDELKRFVYEYRFFWFECALSDREAYQIESEQFHSANPKKAREVQHPLAPAESGWHCPVCQR